MPVYAKSIVNLNKLTEYLNKVLPVLLPSDGSSCLPGKENGYRVDFWLVLPLIAMFNALFQDTDGIRKVQKNRRSVFF